MILIDLPMDRFKLYLHQEPCSLYDLLAFDLLQASMRRSEWSCFSVIASISIVDIRIVTKIQDANIKAEFAILFFPQLFRWIGHVLIIDKVMMDAQSTDTREIEMSQPLTLAKYWPIKYTNCHECPINFSTILKIFRWYGFYFVRSVLDWGGSLGTQMILNWRYLKRDLST